MNADKINRLRKILLDNKQPVSDIEYTENNYDGDWNLIEEKIPTITTDFSEIGYQNDKFYFVFVTESSSFHKIILDELKWKPDMKIYGFVNFNKTLYPTDSFDLDVFMNSIKKDKYLQFQFDFKNWELSDIYNEYCNLVDIFKKNEILVVDQLKVDLRELAMENSIKALFKTRDKAIKEHDQKLFLSTQAKEIPKSWSVGYIELSNLISTVLHIHKDESKSFWVVLVKETYYFDDTYSHETYLLMKILKKNEKNLISEIVW